MITTEKQKQRKEYQKKYQKEYQKEYRIKNKLFKQKYYKEYCEKNKLLMQKKRNKNYEKNKILMQKYQKEYYEKNKLLYTEKRNKNYEENKILMQKKRKEYYEKNKLLIKKKRNIHLKKRRVKDISFRILSNTRRRIIHALKSNKKSSKTFDLLGCDIVFLKQYLESKFKDGMCWENYGLKGWHIDHIKPCYLFDFKNIEEQKQCFHYTNLQPLSAIDNLIKGKKWENIL